MYCNCTCILHVIDFIVPFFWECVVWAKVWISISISKTTFLFHQHVFRCGGDSDWSIEITWPEYWPLIGQYWSHDLDTGLWLASTGHVTWILASDWSIVNCCCVSSGEETLETAWVVKVRYYRRRNCWLKNNAATKINDCCNEDVFLVSRLLEGI